MLDDLSDIAAFYDSDPVREDARLGQHQLEYELTWRYLDRHLPTRGRVLEVGAASGRYTIELARRGYQVTAIDLSPALIELCRQQVTEAGLADQVQFAVADAHDLTGIEARECDAALLMGPLYHLIAESDRREALRQAYDRLRPGGIVVSAFLSRLGVLGDLLKNNPSWIENAAEVRSLLDHGRRPDDAPRGGFRGYFARAAEIALLHESIGFETLIVAAVEPAISADDESYNRLSGEQRQRWLDLLFSVSAEPSIVGASRHLLYVGRKGEHD